MSRNLSKRGGKEYHELQSSPRSGLGRGEGEGCEQYGPHGQLGKNKEKKKERRKKK